MKTVARRKASRRLLSGSVRVLKLIGAPIAARPVAAGGIAAFAALFTMMAGNALYAQHGRHPKPMMATRGPMPAAAVAEGANDETLMPVPLVLEVQTALAGTGHYNGRLDGRPGRVTETAIRTFQSDNGLRVDGAASPRLLSQIRQMTAEAPAPATSTPAVAARTERQASLEPRQGGAGAAMNDASPDTATATGAIPVPNADLVKRIQSGLVNAQVASLKPDGIMGEQTRAAIRTFEALEGLDVTGRPEPRILKRLIEIGAVK